MEKSKKLKLAFAIAEPWVVMAVLENFGWQSLDNFEHYVQIFLNGLARK